MDKAPGIDFTVKTETSGSVVIEKDGCAKEPTRLAKILQQVARVGTMGEHNAEELKGSPPEGGHGTKGFYFAKTYN